VVHPPRHRAPGRGVGSAPAPLTYAPGIAADPDDRSLAAAARAGDRGALDTLLRRHQDRWWRLCRRLTGNDADACDALQEAMIAVARGIRRYDGRAAFTTWAYRVTTNACLDELRRRARRPLPGMAGGFVAGDGGGGDRDRGFDERPPVDLRIDVESVVDRLDVDAALAQLPPDFRAAVVLRDLCDLDYAEIGRVLGVPAGTVKSRIARGRALLADRLGNPSAAPERPTNGP
jgi:RNA polymerase sigma-70 factor (ECF subfamily)